ncbi:hypothetical protein CIHG_05742 [Coccidioides immitis H538.4]|uniref:Uncharacterized protein n=1 Tax=Coccidioides immitis H538.4 TaxID=396776 RepID=A0A0J8RRV0_COCIT|nr:hypothetical protein CIHG_05742 [Coccidioides immitis H538.4]TPX20701.1 hypothetical protein DIZ76_016596 [Coccidioides immitis]
MRSSFFSTIVAALAAATAAVPFPGPVAAPKGEAFIEASTPNFLRPIKLSDLEPQDNLNERTLPDFSCFKPVQNANMLFGGLAGSGKLFLANMTLHASDNLPIVMMETFEDLTSAVDCKGDDGEMSLTFKSKAAYEFAITSWDYINAKTDAEFLMIANHASCGPEGQRQAYRITDVINDAGELCVTLKAKAVAWKQFAGAFDIDFGHYKMSTQALFSLQAKGVIGWIGEAIEKFKDGLDAGFKGGIKDIIDVIDGDGDICLPVNIPINIFKPNTEVTLYKGPGSPAEIELSCQNCYVQGTFLTTGTLKVENYLTTELKLEIEPKDFSTAAEFELDLVNVKKEIKYSQTIFEKVIPFTGIEIPGILSIGAKVGLLIHGDVKFTGSATVNFGCTAKLPNGGKMTLVLIGDGKSGVVGLDKIEAKSDVTFNNGYIDLDTTTVPESKITWGFEILGGAGIEAGVKFGIPIDLNLTAGLKEGGWCPDSNVKTGVTLAAGASLQLDLGVWEVDRTPIFEIPLLDFPIQCPKYCKPLPGLEPGKNEPGKEEPGKGEPEKGNPGTKPPMKCNKCGKCTPI